MSVESTDATLVPIFRRSVGAALPVTTTSLRFTALTLSAMSPTALSPALTVTDFVTGWYPMRRTVIDRAPGRHRGERELTVVRGRRADACSGDRHLRLGDAVTRRLPSLGRERCPWWLEHLRNVARRPSRIPSAARSKRAEHHPSSPEKCAEHISAGVG